MFTLFAIRILEHLEFFPNPLPGEPFCALAPLPFSMYALEHLEGVQNRRSLVAPPERSVLTAVDMTLEVFGSLIHHALKKVSNKDCVFLCGFKGHIFAYHGTLWGQRTCL